VFLLVIVRVREKGKGCASINGASLPFSEIVFMMDGSFGRKRNVKHEGKSSFLALGVFGAECRGFDGFFGGYCAWIGRVEKKIGCRKIPGEG
jgi:hypothetical protein